MLRSVAIVIGSYALSVVLVMATSPLLSRLFPGEFDNGHVPSDTALITSTVLFFIVSIFCAWVCARFAPGSPLRHVVWFVIIGEAMGAVFTIANWSKDWPHWYWLSWMLAWPVGSWVGLLLSGRRDRVSALVRS